MEVVKPFNKRAFVSLVLGVSGLLLPVSGIILHGQQSVFMTPERHLWMSIHNTAALLFTIAAVYHSIANRNALVHYLRKIQSAAVSREALAAILIVLGLVGLIASHTLLIR